jgi:hypothetical protein
VNVFFGKLLENQISGPYLWATFSYKKNNALVLTKIGWAAFWAIFSQTHLVTLDQYDKTTLLNNNSFQSS